MSKITKLTERWVAVTPPYHGQPLPTKELCEEIAQEIRRHVNGLDVTRKDRGVDICEKRESFCEYCGSPWTEKNGEYNGGCCGPDEEAQDARKEVAHA